MAFSVANLPKFLVKNLLPALRALPPRAALKVVSDLGRMDYTLNVPRRLRFDAAVRRASAVLNAEWGRSTARELAANEYRWRARDLFLDGLPDDAIGPYFHVTGEDHLKDAFARQRGAVLLFNHFGPFLMPAHWIVRKGYPLRWFTERPRQISKVLSREFGDDGPLGQKKLFISRRLTPKEGSTAVRRAVRILKAGMIVQLAGDVRWSGSRNAWGTLLGRRYRFTTTWLTLAAMSGAPVVPTFSVMRPDGACDVEFLEPFDVPADVFEAGAEGGFVQGNLDRIEAWVRRHPENSLDYFFWSEADVTGEEAE